MSHSRLRRPLSLRPLGLGRHSHRHRRTGDFRSGAPRNPQAVRHPRPPVTPPPQVASSPSDAQLNRTRDVAIQTSTEIAVSHRSRSKISPPPTHRRFADPSAPWCRDHDIIGHDMTDRGFGPPRCMFSPWLCLLFHLSPAIVRRVHAESNDSCSALVRDRMDASIPDCNNTAFDCSVSGVQHYVVLYWGLCSISAGPV